MQKSGAAPQGQLRSTQRLRAYFLASSTDTLRKSFSSLLNGSLVVLLYLKIGVLGECGDLLLDLSY